MHTMCTPYAHHTACTLQIVRPVLDADEIDLRGVSVGFLKEFREKIISKTAWIEKQSDKQGT